MVYVPLADRGWGKHVRERRAQVNPYEAPTHGLNSFLAHTSTPLASRASASASVHVHGDYVHGDYVHGVHVIGVYEKK